ncbi:unnamed protein product [Vitrella brassicaformis CCMP3155]|uniref:Uncharacterized protein n=1 Tax=Vitrella brassicaformis (strain CCMP3155) TaxID=1169540 RepID=A0A0G4GBH8_VITBC|nr:unnamed protein product [Vitrella brassicaformis CCMP3155]|eukprot:CEM26489.1 unnamed protein product [Vitrella brassicaformis CCMP3155]
MSEGIAEGPGGPDGSMHWPQRRAVWVNQLVRRASRIGCGDTTIMRAVRLVSVADVPNEPTHTWLVVRWMADRSECGLQCLERLFTAAGMDTHGRLLIRQIPHGQSFLSMCDVDLAACDVGLLAATAVYITRKTNQDQTTGRIWSAALVAESSVSEAALESSVVPLRMQRLMWGDTQTAKGIVTDAVDEMFASPRHHGVASIPNRLHQQVSVWWIVLLWLWRMCCRVWSSSEQTAVHNHPQQQQQAGNKEHPLAHFFADDRCCIPDISTTLQLRAKVRCFRDAFSPTQLRSRLDHSMARGGIDTQLVQFDPSLGMRELLAAVWIGEEGGRWDETREVLQLASQCRYCTLPVNLTADNINTHASKTLNMVGRHIHFSDGRCLQLFQHNGEVRAITDEPDFRLEVDPPPPAGHLYRQHRQPHDPPMRESIYYSTDCGWVSFGGHFTDASVSSFVKFMVLDYFNVTHQINEISTTLNRFVAGGRLDGLLIESPHTPVAGCTTTLGLDGDERLLVLTDGSHPFVAWIDIRGFGNNNVLVSVVTTESSVCEGGPFKHRFPVTTRLARVALGPGVAPYVFDGQVDNDSDDDDDSDGHGDDSDDMDADSDGEEENDEDEGDNGGDESDGDGGDESDEMDLDSEHRSGGEDASAEEENGRQR